MSRPDLTCRIAETGPNFARNSPATISNIEFRSLELQRFLTLLKLCSIELRAKLRCGVSLLWSSLLLRGCQCNAVLSGALVLYLVHCFVAMKPVTPLRARVSAGLKPVTPLRGENVGFSGVEGSQW